MRRRILRLRTFCLFLALLPGALLAQQNAGATAYKEVCAVCHGPKGEGVANLGPAIKGSDFVKSADADALKSLIKHGRTGKDKRYPQIAQGMPGQAVSEAEMEALVPFIKVELQK